MAELKTQKTAASVPEFLKKIPDETRREDAEVLVKMLARITRSKPALWGPSILGFGQRTLVYPSGRKLEWMKLGFSPRKANTVLYLPETASHTQVLKRLGKHKLGKGCLYINKLSDVDLEVLEELVRATLAAE